MRASRSAINNRSIVSGKVNVGVDSLNLKLTLEGGQCFRWTRLDDDKWTGVVYNILWVLKQCQNHVEYTASSYDKISATLCSQYLSKYFRLGEDLNALYETWSRVDPHFAKLAKVNCGLRVLDQDPIENLFSFICSSNNNITRISSMIEKMCTLYGRKVFDDEHNKFYAFPSVEALAANGVENTLRTEGFGYRAKYISNSAQEVLSLGGASWLTNLSLLPYAETKQELVKLPGVGPKVADCVCLMSLGHLCAVPVDTHMYQIAKEHYLPKLRGTKSCTPKIYDDISNHFVEIYGPYAGWAQAVLFSTNLKKFKEESKGKDESPKKIKPKKTLLKSKKTKRKTK